MASKLQQYFPMLRERDEILKEIRSNQQLSDLFDSWRTEQQEEFLNFCCGASGVKMLYDSFFKEILNPEYHPERLNDFLSCLLGMQVKILLVLPNDSTRLGDENSLVIMDIVVELEDGSIINIEMQKIGYKFPGERCACYSSDLLLRQYRRVRDEKKKFFNYHHIKPVYTIVLFDESPKEFKSFPNNYMHFFEQFSDTGLQLNLLQRYLFIPLDIFKKLMQNKLIKNKRDAWLLFLSSDNVEDIIYLIKHFPEFKPMYEEIYSMCQNMEDVMGIFSKELQILDQNTVKYMMDEQQSIIDEQKDTISRQNDTIDQQNNTIDQQNSTIDQQNNTISDLKAQIAALREKLAAIENQNNN